MGNFSLALDYLEYAGTVAKTEDEFRRILTVLYTAERFVHPRQEENVQHKEEDPPTDDSEPFSPLNNPVSKLFYQRTTEGCPTEDYFYDDFLHLRDRLIAHLSLKTCEKNSLYPITFSSPIINKKSNSLCILS